MGVERDITAILASGNAVMKGVDRGNFKFGSTLLRRDLATRVEPLCWDGIATINTAANTITFRAVALDTLGANAVLIGNEEEVAATGQLSSAPGFLFSDFFSGCLFFLFRDAHGSVYGVHSYRASGTYPNPMPYFNRLGAKLLYFFNSGGQFTPPAYPLGTFGAVIVYVSQNKITVHFCATQQDGRVLGVVDHARIDNWRAAPGIPDPALGGALAPWTPPPVQPPAAMGLKKRVARWILNYH
jgi:hypothetical protein